MGRVLRRLPDRRRPRRRAGPRRRRQALGIEDPAEAKQALIDAFQNDDAAALKPISEFWNTGFDATSLPDDPGLYLSAGPYVLTSYDELSQMTFEINPDYDWGPKPKVATIVYRIIGDPTAAVQAMENEEIDIIQPQATADILTQLEALADRGVEVETGDDGTYEHVDLVFDNGGPFDPATYGGDEETALAVRQAFLKTIPRQEIVDRLIVPLNPDADAARLVHHGARVRPTTRRSPPRTARPSTPRSTSRAPRRCSTRPASTTPIDVRLLFAAEQPAAGQRVRADPRLRGPGRLQRHRRQQPDVGRRTSNTTRCTTPRCSAGSRRPSTSPATEAQLRHRRAEQLRRLLEPRSSTGSSSSCKSSTDPDEQQELLLEIEQNLWADAFGVTIFQHPAITAYNSTYVTNVSAITAVADDVLELLGVGSRLT